MYSNRSSPRAAEGGFGVLKLPSGRRALSRRYPATPTRQATLLAVSRYAILHRTSSSVPIEVPINRRLQTVLYPSLDSTQQQELDGFKGHGNRGRCRYPK